MSFKLIKNFEELYVTADLHLSNKVNRTISYRGFDNGEEHTKFIRNLINSTIKNKSATLYILGDVGYRDDDDELIHFIKSLTPRVKISLGNHDSEKQLKKIWSMGIIQDFKHDYKINWNGNLFHLNHFPLLEHDGFYRDAFQCFGHCHGNIKPYLRCMDVGLDANNMNILNLNDVVNMRQMYHNIDKNGNRIDI